MRLVLPQVTVVATVLLWLRVVVLLLPQAVALLLPQTVALRLVPRCHPLATVAGVVWVLLLVLLLVEVGLVLLRVVVGLVLLQAAVGLVLLYPVGLVLFQAALPLLVVVARCHLLMP
jgi:hypothetical protein